MERAFLNIDETSAYLNIKKSFLYTLVEAEEIPHYRLGRLIRFQKNQIDQWMEEHRKEPFDTSKRARAILKTTDRGTLDIDRIVKKSIAEVKESCYPSDHGKPDRIGGLRREVKDEGFVS
jgi:excisionase family DNA binding protein